MTRLLSDIKIARGDMCNLTWAIPTCQPKAGKAGIFRAWC